MINQQKFNWIHFKLFIKIFVICKKVNLLLFSILRTSSNFFLRSQKKFFDTLTNALFLGQTLQNNWNIYLEKNVKRVEVVSQNKYCKGDTLGRHQHKVSSAQQKTFEREEKCCLVSWFSMVKCCVWRARGRSYMQCCTNVVAERCCVIIVYCLFGLYFYVCLVWYSQLNFN